MKCCEICKFSDIDLLKECFANFEFDNQKVLKVGTLNNNNDNINNTDSAKIKICEGKPIALKDHEEEESTQEKFNIEDFDKIDKNDKFRDFRSIEEEKKLLLSLVESMDKKKGNIVRDMKEQFKVKFKARGLAK